MTAEIVLAVIMFAAAAGLYVVAARQLRCKGRCLNNAYIYATKQEREKMDLTPYYKQSGKIFLMLGVTAVLEGLYVLLKAAPLLICGAAVTAAVLIYAVYSTVKIEKENQKNREKEKV